MLGPFLASANHMLGTVSSRTGPSTTAFDAAFPNYIIRQVVAHIVPRSAKDSFTGAWLSTTYTVPPLRSTKPYGSGFVL